MMLKYNLGTKYTTNANLAMMRGIRNSSHYLFSWLSAFFIRTNIPISTNIHTHTYTRTITEPIWSINQHIHSSNICSVWFSVVCPVHQRQIVLSKVQPEKQRAQKTVNICTHTLNRAQERVLRQDIIKKFSHKNIYIIKSFKKKKKKLNQFLRVLIKLHPFVYTFTY